MDHRQGVFAADGRRRWPVGNTGAALTLASHYANARWMIAVLAALAWALCACGSAPRGSHETDTSAVSGHDGWSDTQAASWAVAAGVEDQIRVPAPERPQHPQSSEQQTVSPTAARPEPTEPATRPRPDSDPGSARQPGREPEPQDPAFSPKERAEREQEARTLAGQLASAGHEQQLSILRQLVKLGPAASLAIPDVVRMIMTTADLRYGRYAWHAMQRRWDGQPAALLAAIGDAEALPPLCRVLHESALPTERLVAALLLCSRSELAVGALPDLTAALDDPHEQVRKTAAAALAMAGPAAAPACPALVRRLADLNSSDEICAALIAIGSAACDAVPILRLLAALDAGPAVLVRRNANATAAQFEAVGLATDGEATVLLPFRDLPANAPAAVPVLLDLLGHDRAEVRAMAATLIFFVLHSSDHRSKPDGWIDRYLVRLPDLLADPDARVREAAIGTVTNWSPLHSALPDGVDDGVFARILDLAGTDPDAGVRAEAIHVAICNSRRERGERLLVPLEQALKDPSRCVRLAALNYLLDFTACHRQPGIVAAICTGLGDPDPGIRERSVWAFNRAADVNNDSADEVKQALSRVLPLLQDPHPDVRDAGSHLIRYFSSSSGIEHVLPHRDALMAALHDPDAGVRSNMIGVLSRIAAIRPDPGIHEALVACVHDPDLLVRCPALRAVVELQPIEVAAPLVIAALNDVVENVRTTALLSIPKLGPAISDHGDVTPGLLRALNSDYVRPSVFACDAIVCVDPERVGADAMLTALLECLEDDTELWGRRLRVDAASALAHLLHRFRDVERAVRGLHEFVRDELEAAKPWERALLAVASVVTSMGRLDHPSALTLDTIRLAASCEHDKVRAAAENAMESQGR